MASCGAGAAARNYAADILFSLGADDPADVGDASTRGDSQAADSLRRSQGLIDASWRADISTDRS